MIHIEMKKIAFVYLFIKKKNMFLIKKIHYYLVYLSLRSKQIEPAHAKVMSEQYIYFYYKN